MHHLEAILQVRADGIDSCTILVKRPGQFWNRVSLHSQLASIKVKLLEAVQVPPIGRERRRSAAEEVVPLVS